VEVPEMAKGQEGITHLFENVASDNEKEKMLEPHILKKKIIETLEQEEKAKRAQATTDDPSII
jgi:hypothetical protein